MGIGKNVAKTIQYAGISYQVGLTEPGLPSDSEVINYHGSL